MLLTRAHGQRGLIQRKPGPPLIFGKVFGEFGNPENALYIPFVEALFQFANDKNNASIARNEANS